ncbi:MAG: AlbA family DNA-binding domain-containing protein, partial [Planctomycetota bacterium]
MELITFFKTSAKNNEQRILKFFLIAVLPFMALLTAVAFVDYQASKNEILAKIIRDEGANANKRIANFFDPIFRDVQYFQSQGNEGKLNPEQTDQIWDFLDNFSYSYLQNVKEVLFFDGQNTWTYTLNSDKSAPARHTGPLHDLDVTLKLNTPNKIEWVDGDFNLDTKQSSMLAENVFINPKTKKVCSFALHIDTTQFIQGLDKHMADPQRLLLLPQDQTQPPILFDYMDDNKPTLTRIDLPEMRSAQKAWAHDETKEAMSFIHDGKSWQGSILKLNIKKLDPENGDMYSALLVPESKMITAFRKGRLSLPHYASIVTIIALFATIFLWRRYQHELKMATRPPLLTEMTDGELIDTINTGEGDQLEFKSTLRWNLKANRPGKEIEISALKTIVAFLNSEGGSLIVGIEDNGNILGIEADNFPNEDK